MITVNVPPQKRSSLARWLHPCIVAVFSFRYDAQLVPDLLENIRPLVDGWVSWDDRGSQEAFSTDTERRHALIEAAHAAGARWVLAVDPDERFEVGIASRVRSMVRVPAQVCWTFELRELYRPTAYRIDGIWGRKRQKRLFPVFDAQFPIKERLSLASKPLHDSWLPGVYATLNSGLNLYHLKMIEPARRVARSQLYNALDPGHVYQSIGYDYLADDTGAVLEDIPKGRHYLPPHPEDGGLWMADPASVRSGLL